MTAQLCNKKDKKGPETKRLISSAINRRQKLSTKVAKIRPYDILCGRDKAAFNNIGNRRFRVTINLNLPRYVKAHTKHDKSEMIISLVRFLRGTVGARFLKKKGKSYFELDEKQARSKVGHALRDMLVAQAEISRKKSETEPPPEQPEKKMSARKTAPPSQPDNNNNSKPPAAAKMTNDLNNERTSERHIANNSYFEMIYADESDDDDDHSFYEPPPLCGDQQSGGSVHTAASVRAEYPTSHEIMHVVDHSPMPESRAAFFALEEHTAEFSLTADLASPYKNKPPYYPPLVAQNTTNCSKKRSVEDTFLVRQEETLVQQQYYDDDDSHDALVLWENPSLAAAELPFTHDVDASSCGNDRRKRQRTGTMA